MNLGRKIVLIEPKAPRDHVYSRARIPRLGLPTLAAILRKKGYQVRIYQEDNAAVAWQDVAAADYVGISTTTSTAPAAYRIGSLVKQYWPTKPVILGGAHVTFMHEEPFDPATALRFYGIRLPICDYVVRGEAEHLFPELIQSLDGGSPPADPVIGQRLRQDDKIQPSPILEEELDELPFPARDLIVSHRRQPIGTIITSRGCPFDCVFCSVIEMMGRKVRFRSIESVIAEMQQMGVHQYRHIFFADDNLTANPKRAKELMEAMLRHNVVPRQWSAQVRATEIGGDHEMLTLMKRTNCTYLYLGFESVNQRTLDACNKRQSLEQITEATHSIHQHGLRSHGMFVVGFDDDDVGTVRDTATYAIKQGINTIQIFPPIPLPGTRFYEEMSAAGRILHKNWSGYDGAEVVFSPMQMSPAVLQAECFRAMQRMYATPRCVSPFFRGDMYTMVFRGYAHHLLKKNAGLNRVLVQQHERMDYSF